LFDDAAEKFDRVLRREESSEDSVASYGHAAALFSMAERDLMDGKAGSAFENVQRAIESCLQSIKFGCQFKLLGDLYSLGASFPPNVFAEDEDDVTESMHHVIRRQIGFVSKGEGAFRRFLETQTFTGLGEEERLAIRSSISCDIAANVLLQAQILPSLRGSVEYDSRNNISSEVDGLYERAADTYRMAIEENPIHAASWCGFGCAVLNKDPLLAQHSFCRCLQLEQMHPDAYANLGFLYTSRFAFDASRSTMEALTQVADTPMMWINCAFMLERQTAKRLGDVESKVDEDISRAADAYRASLQVMRHPEAQLGLSLTCQIRSTEGKNIGERNRKDAFSLMKEYMGASLNKRKVASAFEGVMCMEKGLQAEPNASWRSCIVEDGDYLINKALANEENTTCLNMKSLQKIKDQMRSEAHVEEQKSTTPMPTGERLQKQILLEPNRADLWLVMAKEAIAKDGVELALESVLRASFMMTEELTSQQLHPSAIVDASMISEAISLSVWLTKLTMRDGENEKGNSEDLTPFNLQRALLMDPGNTIARKCLYYN